MKTKLKTLLFLPLLVVQAVMGQAAEPIQGPAAGFQPVRPANESSTTPNLPNGSQNSSQAFLANPATLTSSSAPEPGAVLLSVETYTSPDGKSSLRLERYQSRCSGPQQGVGCGLETFATRKSGGRTETFKIGGGTLGITGVAVGNDGSVLVAGSQRSNPFVAILPQGSTNLFTGLIRGITSTSNRVSMVLAYPDNSFAVQTTDVLGRVSNYTIDPVNSTYSQVSVVNNPANHPNILRTTTTQVWGFDGLLQLSVVLSLGRDLITTSRLVTLFVRGVKSVAYLEVYKRGRLVSRTNV